MSRSESLSIELALLGYIRDEPLHGYELYQRLSEPEGLWQIWRIKQSRLYAMLDRLESAGYVTSEREPQPNRPPRKVLHLTPAGERAFKKWMTTPVTHGRQVRLEFLTRLFFAWREGGGAASQLLGAQQEICAGWLAETEVQLQEVADRLPYQRQVHRFRQLQIEAMMAWLADCARVLEQEKGETVPDAEEA